MTSNQLNPVECKEIRLEELPNFQCDSTQLNQYLDEVMEQCDPIVQSPNLSGWPILNENGDKFGGFKSWHQCLNEDGTFNRHKAYKLQYVPEFNHDKRTPFVFGYMKKIVDEIQSKRT